MQEIKDYLQKLKIFYISTIDDDKPRVRPFGVCEIIDGKFYIQTGKKKDIAKQLLKNNHIEICACDGPTWLRLEGEAILDEDVNHKKIFLDLNPILRNIGYDENDDNTQIYSIENAKATFYSFTSEPRIITF